VTGHRPVHAFLEVPLRLYPGMFEGDSLLSKYFQRARPGKYVRHDLRIWESSYGRNPRIQDDQGSLLLGDEALDDWRKRSAKGAARMRAYYDVIPARESAITLDPSRRNPWGDPLPRIDFVDSDWSKELREHTESEIRSVYERIAAAGEGKILRLEVDDKTYDHPGGGCRMGDDPAASVVDRFGRAHDHENLWVVGAPTILSGGCNNATLTFVALTLRTASAMRAS
jgi:quinoprotein glucose dehydrogenase